MSTMEEDLDLLLSLPDRVLETPPGSPSPQAPGYLSDDGSPRRGRIGQADMSAFRTVVQDFINTEPQPQEDKSDKSIKRKVSSGVDVEKFSGLRIRNQLVSQTELSDRFADIRFVRLPTIKNLLRGDTLSGCWATVGVLAEKGIQRISSTGKPFCIWKLGCLDENTVTVFLFGTGYEKNVSEKVGTVFALFNCNVRKDNKGTGFSLSVYNSGQMLKMGTSADYGICKGKRKDGVACTLVINKRIGLYCDYHKSKSSEKYKVTRNELKGGNLHTGFRDNLKTRGIYLVDPLADRTNSTKQKQATKVLSVDALKKTLSNAGKVTTNMHSQGIRFLSEITGKMERETRCKEVKPTNISQKRSQPPLVVLTTSEEANAKRIKTEKVNGLSKKTEAVGEKMIEIEFVSSDDED